MNHRKKLDHSGSFKLVLSEEHHTFIEKVYFLYSLFLIMVLEVWIFHKLFSWVSINFNELYLLLCMTWLVIKLLVIYKMEDSFKNKMYLPPEVSSWQLNIIPLFLCLLNSCINVVYLFYFPVNSRDSFILMIYSKIVVACLSVLYICFLGCRLKKIIGVNYNPAVNTMNSETIGFGDIILVKRDDTIYTIDEKVETLDFGYKNDVLLLQDSSCNRIPLLSIRAILLVNGLDFNKVLIPDTVNKRFIVKDLIGCTNWEDRSTRTNAEIIRVLNANFI